MIKRLSCAFILLIASPVMARDSLGVYSQWAAFRDADMPRCYAIAAPVSKNKTDAFASIGTWPTQKVRGQFHIRLSQASRNNGQARLTIGNQRFTLTTQGRNAWAKDKAEDAAIIAAMRSANRMSVRARTASGTQITDVYSLDGAATAMDAAIVGCAQL